MTKEALAQQLHGREYLEEISDAEAKQAKADGLLVIFGYSDDNVELRGAVDDEIGASNGAEFFLHRGGLLEQPNEDCDKCKERAEVEQKKCAEVKAIWCGEDGYSWTYQTAVPHATFDIMEDGDKFCRGIVIAMSDLPTL